MQQEQPSEPRPCQEDSSSAAPNVTLQKTVYYVCTISCAFSTTVPSMQSVMSTAPPPSSPTVLTEALQQLNIAETQPSKLPSQKAKQRRSAPTTPTHQHLPSGKRSSSRPSEARRQKSTDLRRDKRDSIEELFGFSEPPSSILIQPSQLGIMLKNNDANTPFLIDMRDYNSYESIRIRQSVNVSLPSLLVKRYRRGTASNFSLESFISTVEGKQYYIDWQRRHRQSKKPARIVVYDERDADEDSHVSIVLGALERTFCRQQRSSYHIQLYSLEGGFAAFKEWDTWSTYLTGTDPSLLKTTCLGTWHNHEDEATKQTNHLRIVTPMQSRSTSTLSSATSPMNNVDTNVQRRASLFSLDTSSSFSRSRRGSTRSKLAAAATNDQQRHKSNKNVSHGIQFNPPDLADISENSPATATMPTHPCEELNSAPPVNKPSVSPMTPQTDAEYDFVISEIVPGFLFLGPEISTSDQVSKLQSRSIKRILNMAEECDDDVPGLKQVIKYNKVAARDTVEMQNVEETLRNAVQIIVDAKKHHEPIYVHCKAGKSRSVAAILAYLVLVENWTLKRAYQHIIKARPSMSPNIGFVAELLKLEQSVHGKVSNFATPDWQTNPPSPGSQLALGKLQMAWKSSSGSSHSSSNGN